MALYPLLMTPYFRSGDDTPWGGSMLRDAFLKDAPERTGESLEISALPGRESSVRNGSHAGLTLPRMIELWGAELTGAPGGFPLLLKLIDAQQAILGDDGAADEPGCSRAWVVLNCEPGARIACGLDAEGGDAANPPSVEGAASALHWVAVRPGDVFYIPGGAIHALGAGIQAYALQPCSGQAAGPVDASLRAEKLRGVTNLCRGGSRTYYISDSHFELCRLNVSGAMPVSDGRMLLLTPLGPCRLRWGEGELELMPFDSALVPAALEGVSIESDDCKVLMASLPDQEALRSALGYRAEAVAGLA